MEGTGFETRLGKVFTAPVQTGSDSHPVSCKNCYGVFFWGIKRPRRDLNQPSLSSVEVKEIGQLYL
jgi:hypothetical protein